MITKVLRRSCLDSSRRTLSASLTSINAALFHHHAPSAATVSDLTRISSSDVKPCFALPPPMPNSFGVKARELHFQSGPSEFRSSMVSESLGSSGGDGLAISELGISPEIVKALSAKGIEKLFPIQKKGGGEESTSKIKGTRMCIAIRSFDNPEKQAWCLPPHTRYAAMPDTRTLYTVLRSPHVDKKSREQFEMRFKKRFLVIKAQSHELSKKLFWLKRYRILGAQYELQFHCKTRLDMAPVLGNINGSTIGQ